MSVPEIVVDGIKYVPQGSSGPKIGIGVTTRNRNSIVNETLSHIETHSPNAFLVVVDDASAEPVRVADYRFEEQAGIARAKNKCLELLVEAGCEQIFLFDDDAYPLVSGWEQPYIDSPEPHLMRMFQEPAVGGPLNDIAVLHEDDQHIAYSGPRGMMLYVHRSVLDVVGGMDPIFGVWGYEHGDWSNRIHHAGLTTWRYADVKGSETLIYSLDEHNAVERVVPGPERQRLVEVNAEIHNRRKAEGYESYVEFRETQDVVLTCLITGGGDPQRSTGMAPSWDLLDTLTGSLATRGINHVVFADQLTGAVERVATGQNPYYDRWLHYWQWLQKHPEIRYVWCVDGTDVEMLHDPFPMMERGVLYLGSEATLVSDDWLKQHHRARLIQDFIYANGSRTLLNAGLVGGDRATVMSFLQKMLRLVWDNASDRFLGIDTETLGLGDMALLNYVGYTYFEDKIVTGPQVHTVFKAEDTINEIAWWRHK